MFRLWINRANRVTDRIGQPRRFVVRPGLTLVELIVASAVMALMAAGFAALAVSVQAASDCNFGRAKTLQHGRVAVERIQRAINNARTSSSFPGFVVFTELIDDNSFPETLVVWTSDNGFEDPTGLPWMNELVTFCPDPQSPNRLLEIRLPDDIRPAPPLDDAAAWAMELQAIKSDAAAERVELTDLLRVVSLTLNGRRVPRAVVRFESALRPSVAEWSEYQAGKRTWDNVSWVRGIYGANRGLRQSQSGMLSAPNASR
jgi:prepilin-type N-terminal cleavage/methylation domain-containing protein